LAVLAEFTRAVARASSVADARVVILTGAGGAFYAGTDLSDLSSTPGAQRGLRGRAEESAKWWPLTACPKPEIAAQTALAMPESIALATSRQALRGRW
jgi:enoyl-CoA hydratase/carnithine racemase